MRFIYAARNSSGERIAASEEADTADDLIARLQLRGLFVTGIKVQADIPAKSVSHSPQKAKAHKFSHSGIKADDLTVFARQLAISLDSGVPLLKSLGSILRQIPSRKFHDVVTKISYDVESGFSFRDSLAKHSRVFSNLWINLIEPGEASGNLPTILERLAGYLERRAAFQRKIVSAMVYPIILVAVAMIAVVIFILAVIPKFTEIFSNFDIELPAPTKMLIATSDFLRGNFLLLSVIIVAIIIALTKFRQTTNGKAFFDNMMFKFPVIKEYLRLAETERFSSTMATLLESGVPILYALEIAEKSAGTVIVAKIIRSVKNAVREGRTLTQPLDESAFFPPMVTQMINIGEEVGDLDKMFKKIAAYYAEIMETQITRFASMFEPIMIVVMGATIGSMVVSMFLPIFKLATIGSN